VQIDKRLLLLPSYSRIVYNCTTVLGHAKQGQGRAKHYHVEQVEYCIYSFSCTHH
jgi:hypothetical protein